MSLRSKQVAMHVGAHKTGTSVIQHYLREHKWLLARHRIFYVRRSEMNDLVGWGGKLETDPEALPGRIAAILRNPWFRVVIASHENTLGRPFVEGARHLYGSAPQLIAALGTSLRDFDAKVFISIRPQDQFVESYYLQLVHQGRHETFTEWLREIDLDALSWRPVVEGLRETFGADRVEVVDFRLILQGQEAYIQDFFRRVDPRFRFPVDFPSVRNPSISEKGLRMALSANPFLETGPERRLMRKFLQKHFSNVDYPRPALLTDEQRQWLQDRYGAEYEELVSAGAPSRAPVAAR